ncbi:MAG: 4Fe-4S dicluster domain-containing protein [Gammaproteobacteria bacterium]|nr:4Fe-4S dicluster domain-containing protein [Gammaproteobacteria bacterium]
MSELDPITVNVDEYLGLNKYEVDEGHPHITVVAEPDLVEFRRLVRVCPAGLYKLSETGEPTFDYAGCLECGTCRIAAGGSVVATWEYPQPTMGVEYRYG